MKTPAVLILTGSNDQQADPLQVPEWAAAFKSAGNHDVTVRVLPATNHLFLPDPDGDPSNYGKLQVHAIPRSTLGIIADWLAARLVAGAKR